MHTRSLRQCISTQAHNVYLHVQSCTDSLDGTMLPALYLSRAFFALLYLLVLPFAVDQVHSEGSDCFQFGSIFLRMSTPMHARS